MKSKIIVLVISVIVVIGAGVGYLYYKNNSANNQNITTGEKQQTKNKEITKEEAEKILENKYGKKDQETGNTMSYGYMATVKDKNGNKYYAYRHSWLVDNSHLSFLQNIFISLDGKTIKTTSTPDGFEDGDLVEF